MYYLLLIVFVLSSGWYFYSWYKRASTPPPPPPPPSPPCPSPPSPPSPLLVPQKIQKFKSFLVLDVEATCEQHSGFDYPNEIIEFPICLLQWSSNNQLEVVDQFTTFVQPQYRPILSDFCTELTGINQGNVNHAPRFKRVLKNVKKWLVSHGLIDPNSDLPLQPFIWCSDGHFDIQDFVLKQSFMSKLPFPPWLKHDFLNVRKAVSRHLHLHNKGPRPLNISAQLDALGLAPFIGQQHSGIDDCRNISRIVIELANRDVVLKPNTKIDFNKRWPWMGKNGEILENVDL